MRFWVKVVCVWSGLWISERVSEVEWRDKWGLSSTIVVLDQSAGRTTMITTWTSGGCRRKARKWVTGLDRCTPFKNGYK